MEPIRLFDKICEPNMQNNCRTPSRLQKHLFGQASSSSKRSLFRESDEIVKEAKHVSDAESDLGPMSPLALTDHSSCDSSPGRQFVSPFASPQCELSPRPKLYKLSKEYKLPSAINVDSTNQDSIENDIVPETPTKICYPNDHNAFSSKTPQKSKYSENKLITPLDSIRKSIPIPRIHKRKSSVSSECQLNQSPEIKKCVLKGDFDNALSTFNAKRQKMNVDEMSLAPKARTALFQENNKFLNEKDKGFTLNSKSFYGSSNKMHKPRELERKEPQFNLKRKENLPPYSNVHRRSSRKYKKGEINSGVRHGIKRPKPKRRSTDESKSFNQSDNLNSSGKENLKSPSITMQNNQEEKSLPNDTSNEIDHSKKFFKHKLDHKAVFTVNNNIKLKISTNEIKTKYCSKRTKLDKNLFNANDLNDTHTEPLLTQNKVANILKILEDDWSDDFDDTVETARTTCSRMNTFSPKNSDVLIKDVTMSPASELSNMASTMHIKDFSTKENMENVENAKTSDLKLYPLFSQGYSPNITYNENKSKKRKRATSWQLSTKSGIDENQYQIDAGQKLFGAKQCNECGILYHIGDPDDEKAHMKHHDSLLTLKFLGWKNERIIYKDCNNSSRIILIEPEDSNLHWNKVNEVLEIVDNDLGLSDIKISFYRDKKIYMYIKNKTILGVLVAEYVKHAYQMIPELIDLNCCTSETTAVKCGINVIWTVLNHRRQGIATKLLDILRTNYYYGYIMSVEDIAFSTPTLSGKIFAEKYTKTKNFKVY